MLTCEANLFAAHKAAILLGFGGLRGFELLTASSGGMGGRECRLTQHWRHKRKKTLFKKRSSFNNLRWDSPGCFQMFLWPFVVIYWVESGYFATRMDKTLPKKAARHNCCVGLYDAVLSWCVVCVTRVCFGINNWSVLGTHLAPLALLCLLMLPSPHRKGSAQSSVVLQK